MREYLEDPIIRYRIGRDPLGDGNLVDPIREDDIIKWKHFNYPTFHVDSEEEISEEEEEELPEQSMYDTYDPDNDPGLTEDGDGTAGTVEEQDDTKIVTGEMDYTDLMVHQPAEANPRISDPFDDFKGLS